MAKKVKTVAIHSRISAEDAAFLDRMAEREPSTRSKLVARAVREMVDRQRKGGGK